RRRRGALPGDRALRDRRRAHRGRRLDGSMTRNLGLDLGGTNIKLVVLEDERVVEQDSTPTRSEEGPDAVLARLAEAGRRVGRVDTIGVGLPGLSDEQGRALLFPNLHGDWAGRPIREPLERALRQ